MPTIHVSRGAIALLFLVTGCAGRSASVPSTVLAAADPSAPETPYTQPAEPMGGEKPRTLELEIRVDRVTPELSTSLAPFGRMLEVGETVVRLELKSESDVPRIARTVIEAGCELRALVPKHQDLEELFMDVIEGQSHGSNSTGARA